ncbi:hypothetical protein G6F62_014988 [Rhizopus arrhizus]|nr:hypothetical protein G6F62_014988 [Rhizopus arrhizus]
MASASARPRPTLPVRVRASSSRLNGRSASWRRSATIPGPWSATSSTAWRSSRRRLTSTGGAPWFKALPIRLSSRRPSATASACTTSGASSSAAVRWMSVPAPCQAPTRSVSQSDSTMGA